MYNKLEMSFKRCYHKNPYVEVNVSYTYIDCDVCNINRPLLSYINGKIKKVLKSRSYNSSNCSIDVRIDKNFSWNALFYKPEKGSMFPVFIEDVNEVEKEFFNECARLDKEFRERKSK